jgi:hypothetical protein
MRNTAQPWQGRSERLRAGGVFLVKTVSGLSWWVRFGRSHRILSLIRALRAISGSKNVAGESFADGFWTMDFMVFHGWGKECGLPARLRPVRKKSMPSMQSMVESSGSQRGARIPACSTSRWKRKPLQPGHPAESQRFLNHGFHRFHGSGKGAWASSPRAACQQKSMPSMQSMVESSGSQRGARIPACSTSRWKRKPLQRRHPAVCQRFLNHGCHRLHGWGKGAWASSPPAACKKKIHAIHAIHG